MLAALALFNDFLLFVLESFPVVRMRMLLYEYLFAFNDVDTLAWGFNFSTL